MLLLQKKKKRIASRVPCKCLHQILSVSCRLVSVSCSSRSSPCISLTPLSLLYSSIYSNDSIFSLLEHLKSFQQKHESSGLRLERSEMCLRPRRRPLTPQIRISGSAYLSFGRSVFKPGSLRIGRSGISKFAKAMLLLLLFLLFFFQISAHPPTRFWSQRR